MFASDIANVGDSHLPILAYPMPDKPFLNQGVPPCVTRQGAVELKGGCWIELAKKPPCFDSQAEYDGKCYLPMPKDKPGVPRAFEQ